MTTNKISTMGSLKDKAVRVYNGMISVNPYFSKEETINIIELIPKFNGCFSVNNSTVCFIHDNEVYVTPYTSGVMNFLQLFGFSEENFFVPFSNGDYPKTECLKWSSLRIEARESYHQDFVDACTAYCDKHVIGVLKEETLSNCFKMPYSGVQVKHPHYEDCYYPIIRSDSLDAVTMGYIGRYCKNNGKVVFVYRDGSTYVTKGYKIIKELIAAGYKESGLFVPFSNGEVIQSHILKSKWDAITK